jgi:hypothetical protein
LRASVSTTLSANVEHLTLTGSAAIDGTGNEVDNTITGITARKMNRKGTPLSCVLVVGRRG